VAKKTTKKTRKKKARKAKKSTKSARKKELTQRQRQFLAAVRATFENDKVRNIREACRIARIDSRTHYVVWMSQQRYAEAWEALDDEYQAAIRDAVRAETERRGIEGWDEEVIEEEREFINRVVVDEEGNQQVVSDHFPKKVKRRKTRKHSDMLLALRNNQLFGDSRKIEVTGKGGGPVHSEMALKFGAVLEEVRKSRNGGPDG